MRRWLIAVLAVIVQIYFSPFAIAGERERKYLSLDDCQVAPYRDLVSGEVVFQLPRDAEVIVRNTCSGNRQGWLRRGEEINGYVSGERVYGTEPRRCGNPISPILSYPSDQVKIVQWAEESSGAPYRQRTHCTESKLWDNIVYTGAVSAIGYGLGDKDYRNDYTIAGGSVLVVKLLADYSTKKRYCDAGFVATMAAVGGAAAYLIGKNQFKKRQEKRLHINVITIPIGNNLPPGPGPLPPN